MFVGKKSSSGPTKLGEILVEAGVINNDLVIQSLSIATSSKLPIGRVLSMYGFADDKVIESAVAAQRGLRDGRYSRQQASHLVKVAFTSNVTIDQAQSLVGLRQADSSNLTEVGKMLLAAQILDLSTLNEALALSKLNETSPGQWLLINERISSQLLVNVLHLILLCREGYLPKLDAVTALQKMHADKLSLSEAALALSLGTLPQPKDIHLAAFLIVAQLVDQRLVIYALETAIEKRAPFGTVLIEHSALTPELFEAAVHLQEMVEHELISVEQACEIFAFAADLNKPLDSLLAEFERMSDIAKFIISSGLLPENECKKHGLFSESTDIMMGIALLRSGMVSEKTVGNASYLLNLIKPSALTEREAIGVFHYCERFAVEPALAIKKFGLDDAPQELPPADG